MLKIQKIGKKERAKSPLIGPPTSLWLFPVILIFKIHFYMKSMYFVYLSFFF